MQMTIVDRLNRMVYETTRSQSDSFQFFAAPVDRGVDAVENGASNILNPGTLSVCLFVCVRVRVRVCDVCVFVCICL
jgi:hypothetical protein